MSFWKNKGANPKRKFRFKIEISHPNWDEGQENAKHIWYAKSCTAPSVEVSSVEHMWSDHVFNFPGRAKWGDVEMVLVDPAGGGDGPDDATSLGAEVTANTVQSFAGVLAAFGYEIPAGGGVTADDYKTIARNQIQNCHVVIQSLDDEGNVIEKWTLNRAFPTAFKFGDWDYGSDDLREMNITWKYDWATLDNVPNGPYFS